MAAYQLIGSIDMILSYAKYIDMMSALDEHCKGALEREELQNAIFNHYISLNRTFAAENIRGTKRIFSSYLQSKTKTNRQRKLFRKFMDGDSIKTPILDSDESNKNEDSSISSNSGE